MKRCSKWMGVVGVVAAMRVAGTVWAGSLDPTNAPGATMKTLQEIYDKQNATHQLVEGLVSPQTLSDTTTLVQAGYYATTNLLQVDTDLVAGNIRTNVTVFGIAGTLSTNAGGSSYSAVVPKTGQTIASQTGDDGDYERGAAWPNPRFTLQADTNSVLDNLTGLIWARNANRGGPMTWSNAIVYCEALDYGGQTDWRLPNVREMQSLVDFGQVYPALPSGHPFAGVQQDYYWVSTTPVAASTEVGWELDLSLALTYQECNIVTRQVWPVRAGP